LLNFFNFRKSQNVYWYPCRVWSPATISQEEVPQEISLVVAVLHFVDTYCDGGSDGTCRGEKSFVNIKFLHSLIRILLHTWLSAFSSDV